MTSPDFLRRMDKVLTARVAEKKSRESKPRRILQVGGVIAGTLACFFLLKAAALAHDDQAFAAPVAEAGIGAQIYQWLAGSDPISSTLAAALRNRARPDAATTETL